MMGEEGPDLGREVGEGRQPRGGRNLHPHRTGIGAPEPVAACVTGWNRELGLEAEAARPREDGEELGDFGLSVTEDGAVFRVLGQVPVSVGEEGLRGRPQTEEKGEPTMEDAFIAMVEQARERESNGNFAYG